MSIKVKNQKMKSLVTMITLMCVAMGLAQAQEYKVSKSTGRLEIREVNHVRVEGSTGNEIVFSSTNGKRDRDPRAEGLRSVSNSGLEDNTGLGISVVEKGNVIEVHQLKKMDGPDITIKVPKGVVVSVVHTSPYGNDIEFRNFEGEIEVSTVHSGVELSNVTGPMTVKTVHGDINASLNTSLKSPTSIVSVHGHVDVALPVSMKANLRMKTVYGEIYVDPEFKIDIERKSDNMVPISTDDVSGKINGGGLEIVLSSTHNNVYLRKTK
jgi:predicted membrane protein